MRRIALIALVVVSNARRVQNTADSFSDQLQAMIADPIFKETAARAARPMKAMMADVEQIMEVVAAPSFQTEAMRAAEPIMKMLDDPKVQKEAERVVEQIVEVIDDPTFLEEAERIVEPLMAKMGNPEAMLEDLRALSEDPNFKRLAEQVIAPVKEMMSNEDMQEKAKLLMEQMKEIVADPSFQKEIDRISEPIMAMISDAKQMQNVVADPTFQEEALRISEQMQALLGEQQIVERASPRNTLAALLLDSNSRLSPLDKKRQQTVRKYMEGRIEAFQGSNKAEGVAQVMECFIPDGGSVKPIIDLHAPKVEYAEGREQIQHYLENPPNLPVKFKPGSNTDPEIVDGKAIVKFIMRIGFGFAGVDKHLVAVYEFKDGSDLVQKVTVDYDN
jgi:hypothetical protein